MEPLRERKKRLAQSNILQAAKETFLTKGYQVTTIAEIARIADIGVGTIYNYYSSKAELLIAVLYEEMPDLKQEIHQPEQETKRDIVDHLIHYIEYATAMIRVYPKKFWREIIAVITGGIEGSDKVGGALFQMDQLALHELAVILHSYQTAGSLSDDFDVKEAIECMYSMLLFQFGLFLYQEEMSFETVLDRVRSQFDFVFQEKINGGE